jgi:hypothetical protein
LVRLAQSIAPALRLSRGLDPLGLQTITLDRIMPLLPPGVLVLSQRARLFGLYPFLIVEYQRLGGATTNTALSAFLKHRPGHNQRSAGPRWTAPHQPDHTPAGRGRVSLGPA